MNHLERVSSILGAILVGAAAWLIVSERRARASHPPVEKLAEDLKHAWARYHTP
ncbi:MAG TPA: hypothetical protein VMF91_19185 [Bryobacteraceae bacterium]|nr:hypothetical protein [Bryobacteraceae bacterium]